MTTLITGATGLVGRRLIAQLPEAVALTRDPEAARARLGPTVRCHPWRPESAPPPAAALTGVDTVIHLAGAPVATRWSRERKRRIRESRVAGTRNLVTALADLEHPPAVLVSASAVGWYGDRGDRELTEKDGPGEGFLAQVCREWEEEATRAASLGVRVVTARIGVVLAPEGGALGRMLTPFRLGLGGPLGGGRQYMPWIHIEDVVGLLLHAAATADLTGPLNVTGPEPVTNRAFARALGRALKRPAFLPLPAPVLRLLFGEMAGILLASQRVLPRRAEAGGYRFRHPTLAAALAGCLRP